MSRAHEWRRGRGRRWRRSAVGGELPAASVLPVDRLGFCQGDLGAR
jgi:hypothetical protein